MLECTERALENSAFLVEFSEREAQEAAQEVEEMESEFQALLAVKERTQFESDFVPDVPVVLNPCPSFRGQSDYFLNYGKYWGRQRTLWR